MIFRCQPHRSQAQFWDPLFQSAHDYYWPDYYIFISLPISDIIQARCFFIFNPRPDFSNVNNYQRTAIIVSWLSGFVYCFPSSASQVSGSCMRLLFSLLIFSFDQHHRLFSQSYHFWYYAVLHWISRPTRDAHFLDIRLSHISEACFWCFVYWLVPEINLSITANTGSLSGVEPGIRGIHAVYAQCRTTTYCE